MRRSLIRPQRRRQSVWIRAQNASSQSQESRLRRYRFPNSWRSLAKCPLIHCYGSHYPTICKLFVSRHGGAPGPGLVRCFGGGGREISPPAPAESHDRPVVKPGTRSENATQTQFIVVWRVPNGQSNPSPEAEPRGLITRGKSDVIVTATFTVTSGAPQLSDLGWYTPAWPDPS